MSTRKSYRPIKLLRLRLIGTVGLVVLLLISSTLIPRGLRADLSPPVRVMPTEQNEDEESPEPEVSIKPKRESQSLQSSDAEEIVSNTTGNSIGVFGRASHLAAKTFGRNVSITPIEAMPYLLTDEHFIFADVRGFVTNQSKAGGNFGLGYRRLLDDWNAWAGASFCTTLTSRQGTCFNKSGSVSKA